MKQLRGFKYRFYPTSSQRLALAQTLGHSRFVYNWALNLKTNSFYNEGKKVSYVETSNALTKLKKEEEYKWLKDVSAVPLQQSLRNLNTSFDRFFKGLGQYPKFKKKKSKQSISYTPNAYKWDAKTNQLTLAKMKSSLKIRWGGRYFTECPKSITISKDASNRYFISFLVEEPLIQWKSNKEEIGIDLGITDLVITSKGFQSGNPKYLRKYEAKLKAAQKKLSKKQKGSRNREKARLAVAKLHSKITDCRKDFLHKLTTKLVRENQTLVVETLSVKNMMKNHKLAKSIGDASWGELIRQLTYKSNGHGRELLKIDRWFPSSKRCNNCGYVVDKLPLSVREWTCSNCNHTHQRDVNAAKNILELGTSFITSGDTSGGIETNLVSIS